MQTIPYQLLNGHIVFTLNQKSILLDTGSPNSSGISNTIQLDQKNYPLTLKSDFIKTFNFKDFVGTEIDILLGMDIVSTMEFFIDPEKNEISFSHQPLSQKGFSEPIEQLHNIPIFSFELQKKSMKMFFDTGAKLSYLHSSLVNSFPKLREEIDFHPFFGKFSTPVFDIPIKLASQELSLPFGILPEKLQNNFLKAPINGILGTVLLEHFKIALSLPRKVFIFI